MKRFGYVFVSAIFVIVLITVLSFATMEAIHEIPPAFSYLFL